MVSDDGRRREEEGRKTGDEEEMARRLSRIIIVRTDCYESQASCGERERETEARLLCGIRMSSRRFK